MSPIESHPMWVRGLKRLADEVGEANDLSHPMWVRGLKQLEKVWRDLAGRRTLCGCVD